MLEICRDIRAIEANELIPGVPGIGRRARRICHCRQIPIEVISQALVAQRQLLISGIVGGSIDGLRDARAGERAADSNPSPRFVVGVGQVAKDNCPLFVQPLQVRRVG
jgi:hypothetical protein